MEKRFFIKNILRLLFLLLSLHVTSIPLKLKKVILTLSVPEKLKNTIFEIPGQWVTGSKRVKISVKSQKKCVGFTEIA